MTVATRPRNQHGAPMGTFELCDYQGKLAIHVDTYLDRHKPEQVTRYYVSNCPAGDFYYKSLIGRRLQGDNMHASYTWRDNGTRVIVDYHDWEHVEIRSAVDKPRDGKEYGWAWAESVEPFYGPGWGKVYFPRCDECRHYHDPQHQPCEVCGHCHRPGGKCRPRKCWECGTKFTPTAPNPYHCSEECRRQEQQRLTQGEPG